jgi:hypothetical protein
MKSLKKALELGTKLLENHRKTLQDPIEIGFSEFENQRKFRAGQLDGPVFRRMHFLKFQENVPKLVQNAQRLGIFGDQIPEKTPEEHLEVNYAHSHWPACYGHPAEPELLVESPTICINRNADDTGYYTLVMSDLDRPNLSTKRFEECCHWLV